MKNEKWSADDNKDPSGLTHYRPEEETFQKLQICKYLADLPEAPEDQPENRESTKEEKDPCKKSSAE